MYFGTRSPEVYILAQFLTMSVALDQILNSPQPCSHDVMIKHYPEVFCKIKQANLCKAPRKSLMPECSGAERASPPGCGSSPFPLHQLTLSLGFAPIHTPCPTNNCLWPPLVWRAICSEGQILSWFRNIGAGNSRVLMPDHPSSIKGKDMIPQYHRTSEE